MLHVSQSHGHYNSSITAGIHIGESQFSGSHQRKTFSHSNKSGRDGQPKSVSTSRDGQDTIEVGLNSRAIGTNDKGRGGQSGLTIRVGMDKVDKSR